MKIRLGYDTTLEAPQQVAVVAMLHVHPGRVPDLLEPDVLETSAGVTKEEYVDSLAISARACGRRQANRVCTALR